MNTKTVDSYVSALPPGQAEIISRLRALIRAAVPEARESIKWAQPVYEVNGPMIFIKAFRDHVTFGFWRGAALHDPEHLLEGEGDRMKHVRLRRADEINPVAFTAFVKEAEQLNLTLGDPTRSR
jgi:hypothetical protein